MNVLAPVGQYMTLMSDPDEDLPGFLFFSTRVSNHTLGPSGWHDWDQVGRQEVGVQEFLLPLGPGCC